MAREITDNETYIRLVDRIQNRDLIDETVVTDFEEIVKDGELAQRIYDLAQMSMGKALAWAFYLNVSGFMHCVYAFMCLCINCLCILCVYALCLCVYV